jgi:putative restriction endonuclease
MLVVAPYPDAMLFKPLEAAHIIPYNGPKTNHPANGLLLRADLHVLFDLGLIAVDPSRLVAILAPRLKGTTYAEFEGKTLSLPSDQNLWPSIHALTQHLATSGIHI